MMHHHGDNLYAFYDAHNHCGHYALEIMYMLHSAYKYIPGLHLNEYNQIIHCYYDGSL